MTKTSWKFLFSKNVLTCALAIGLTGFDKVCIAQNDDINSKTQNTQNQTTRKVEPLTNEASKTSLFNAKSYVLSNGLQVVLVHNDLAPIIDMAIYYKVGTADDQPQLHGLSHFVEHLMFKGTQKVPGQGFTRLIQERGGFTNAYTKPDVTAYTTTIASEHFEFLLKLEADRMANLNFSEQDVESEKKVVLEERRMRLENNPYGNMYENLLKALYLYHPYGTPAIGYAHHIESYNYHNARNHYQTWYVPNNAILVVSGDLPENALDLIKQHFEPLPARNVPNRNRPQEPDIKEKIVTSMAFESDRVSQASISWYYKTPHHKKLPPKLYFGLQVLNYILSNRITGPFYISMVREKKIATHVNAHYAGGNLDRQFFEIGADLAPSSQLSDLKQAIYDYIENLKKNGVSEDDLQQAKDEIRSSMAFIQDEIGGATHAMEDLAFGFNLDHIETEINSIEKVTGEDVRQAINLVFSERPSVILTVYPKNNLQLPTIKDDQEKQSFWGSIDGKVLGG